ncbi:ATP-binding protein [Novosphingobium sp. UBA1939]|uniref:ATP-binding protein n=1 Tax=Novosphingobium sp. UBA1939 TaxID=1946982 RepID=UPI0025E4547B|nr:ATP-binding protein [Novosphingobium sp. UBA1939]
MKKLSEDARQRLIRVSQKRLVRERTRIIRRKAKRLNRHLALSDRKNFAILHDIPFDRNVARAQIVLPEVFSFRENHLETTAALQAMRQFALVERRPILLHFSKISRIDPSAALVLVAEIFRIRNLRTHRAVAGTYPKHRIIYDLLSDMGFFELLDIQEVFGRPKPDTTGERSVFLRFHSGNKVDSQTVDRFVGIVEKHILPMNAVARGKLVAAIIEAMNNTLDHAHPETVDGQTMPHRWWMSSEISLTRNEVTILFFDQGVGIPHTLSPDRYDRIRALVTRLSPFPTDGEMIMAATELYRTSTGQSGRGRGFRNMKQFVDTCSDGELQVLSNRGRYVYMPGTDTYGDESLSIGGTVIEWRFRHSGSVDMEE